MRVVTTFESEGRPVSQGNLNAGRTGHLYYANDKALKAYRGQLATDCKDHLPDGWEPEDAPFIVYVAFEFATADAKKWGQRKTTAPDCDKLVRSVGDSLTKVVWSDDSRVAKWEAEKLWSSVNRTTVQIWVDA